jgi:hypothetical protein
MDTLNGRPFVKQAADSSDISFLWKESQEGLLRLLEKGRKKGWHRMGQPFPFAIEERAGWAIWVAIPIEE